MTNYRHSNKLASELASEDANRVILCTEGFRNKANNKIASDITYKILTEGKLGESFYVHSEKPELNFIDYLYSKN